MARVEKKTIVAPPKTPSVNGTRALKDPIGVSARIGALEKKLDEQMKAIHHLDTHMEELHRYLVWRRVWGIAKIFLIFAPIFLAIVYLPPLMETVLRPYKELLGATPTGRIDVKSILQQLK